MSCLQEKLEQSANDMVARFKEIEKNAKLREPKPLRKEVERKLKNDAFAEINEKYKIYGLEMTAYKECLELYILNAQSSFYDNQTYHRLSSIAEKNGLKIKAKVIDKIGFPSSNGPTYFYGVYKNKFEVGLKRVLSTMKLFALFQFDIPRFNNYVLALEPGKESRSIFGSDFDFITVQRKKNAYNLLEDVLKDIYGIKVM